MKVIDKMKNILIQEFQHCLESSLIEVMSYKMLLVQFVSTVNLIRKQRFPIANTLSDKQSPQESRFAEAD
jgi:hypothetical protein